METTCHSGNLCAMCAATSIRCLCVKRKDGQYRYRQKIIHLMEGRVPPVWGRDADEKTLLSVTQTHCSLGNKAELWEPPGQRTGGGTARGNLALG